VVSALLDHLQATLSMNWAAPPSPIQEILEAASALPFAENYHHEIYLDTVDTPLHQDINRASAYREALALLRVLADRKAPLNWTTMATVQGIVLRSDRVEFRNCDAYARDGTDRYAWFPELQAMFERKIEADADSPCNPIAKAVRTYLDIIFFHPFVDGNARAARLWFEFLLRRERVCFPSLLALARLRKTPGSVSRYWAFVTLTGKLILSESGKCG
jgi:Fic family protein